MTYKTCLSFAIPTFFITSFAIMDMELGKSIGNYLITKPQSSSTTNNSQKAVAPPTRPRAYDNLLGDEPLPILESGHLRKNTGPVPLVPVTKDVATTTSATNYDEVKPLWTCGQSADKNSNKKKLIFVHVFKTAGSSFRNLFRAYSEKCHVGATVVTECSGWQPQMAITPNDAWQGIQNQHTNETEEVYGPCRLKDHRWREGQQEKPAVVTDAFLQQESDLLIGHMPIGVHKGWLSDISSSSANGHSADTIIGADDENVEYQYMTFFRDAFHKFVSAFVFINRKEVTTHQQALEGIKENVLDKRANGMLYNQGYANYLLTPYQKRSLETAQERVQQIKQNMLDYRVVIGIVDRMTDSLDMLKHLIDPKDQAAGLFADMYPQPLAPAAAAAEEVATERTLAEDLEKGEEEEDEDEDEEDGEQHKEEEGDSAKKQEKKQLLQANTSRLSTSALVKDLLQDKEFAAVWKDFLKFDIELFDFALHIHERQVAATLQRQPKA